MRPTDYDPCVYVNDKKDLLIALYVDDGLITGASMDKINELLLLLKNLFQNHVL